MVVNETPIAPLDLDESDDFDAFEQSDNEPTYVPRMQVCVARGNEQGSARVARSRRAMLREGNLIDYRTQNWPLKEH